MGLPAGLLDAGYTRLVRPVLFRSFGGDPEAVHEWMIRTLAGVGSAQPVRGAARLLAGSAGRPTRVAGIDFASRVGLAAGMDKDASAVLAWQGLGFGFAELGTITGSGQPGNDRPRTFRLRESKALINRMGFNNPGAAVVAATLAARNVYRGNNAAGIPIGISIGKTKVVGLEDAVEDYLTSLRLLAPHADYVAVNVSSPNTPGLRSLQDAGALGELLGALVAEATRLTTILPERSAPLPERPALFPERPAMLPDPALLPEPDEGASSSSATMTGEAGYANLTAPRGPDEGASSSSATMTGETGYANLTTPRGPDEGASSSSATMTGETGYAAPRGSDVGAVPIFVKVAPDLSWAQLDEVLATCESHGAAGLIATNTTLSRDGVAAADAARAEEAGGLSGAPLTVRAREVVAYLAARTELPVIGSGGIMTAADAIAMFDAGAQLVQLYTGFIYGGPGLAAAINALDSERPGS